LYNAKLDYETWLGTVEAQVVIEVQTVKVMDDFKDENAVTGLIIPSVLCFRDVAVPFVAATVAAVGTGLYLNKVLAKVTVVLVV